MVGLTAGCSKAVPQLRFDPALAFPYRLFHSLRTRFSMSQSQKPKALTVAQITQQIKARLNQGFSNVWVRGEVSGLMQARSGHLYFSLKDDSAQIGAMIWESNLWRIDFDLKDGMELLCLGNVDVYPPRGSYQLAVRQAHQVGVGGKQLALENLKRKLKKLGWFDAARKRPLPRFPKTVAVVTSPKGAAVHDFLQVVARRWPGLKVIVVPTAVQGDGVGPLIANSVRKAGMIRPAVDAIVVTRGGGSAEDLWCFNDETLCKAIYESKIPVISGVGHEIDNCLCDYVADVRALTPSEAAERLVPDQAEIINSLNEQHRRIKRALSNRVVQARSRLGVIASRSVLQRPLDRIHQKTMLLDSVSERITARINQRLQIAKQRQGELAAKLESLSPLGTLARGYSLTTSKGRTVRDSSTVAEGDRIETKLENGKIISRVESTE